MPDGHDSLSIINDISPSILTTWISLLGNGDYVGDSASVELVLQRYQSPLELIRNGYERSIFNELIELLLVFIGTDVHHFDSCIL